MEILTKLVSNLLEITLGGSLVIIILLFLNPLLQRKYIAKWRYWAWLILAFRLIIPINISLPDTPVRIQPPAGAIVVHLPAQTAEAFVTAENGPAATDAGLDSMPLAGSAEMAGPELLALLWLGGSILFFIGQFGAYWYFRRSIRRWCRPVTDQTAYDKLHRLQMEMGIGNSVRLQVCPAIDSPLLVGLFRPLILLPREDYADQDYSMILKHELIHHQRRDIGYKLLMLTVRGLHWFNPLVWLMARQADQDLEISCDDAVISGMDREDRARYGDIILAAVRKNRPKTAALTTYFFGGTKAVKERLTNIFDPVRKGKGIAALMVLMMGLGMSGMLIACNIQEDKPDIRVSVLLQELTEAEYLGVGTAGIKNPVIDDFKKLTVRLETERLANRTITFPTMRDLQELFTHEVYWFGSSESKDNPSETDAYYLLETTLYTRNITMEEIRGMLSALDIEISYTDQQGEKAEKRYNLGDALTSTVQAVPKGDAADVVHRHLKALAANDYESWKSTLWPAEKNEQTFTPAFEKPGDLGVLSLDIAEVKVSPEATDWYQSRYTASELAQRYHWSDADIAENMIAVYARYTVDFDNTKVPYNEGTLEKHYILVREDANSPWLIWDSGQAMEVVYSNAQYGFTFSLPASWRGYSLVSGTWEGFSPEDSSQTVTGPLLSIRHPEWTAEKPRQDIPVMVLTLAQWNALQAGNFHIGAAPINPKELGRNSRFVFALPARYNFAFPAGFEEVEEILKGNPLQIKR